MSVISEEGNLAANEVVSMDSFKEQLRRRRQELEENTVFELAVPGYDNLYARYRSLGFEDVRNIGRAIEAETQDQTTGERLTAAATLAEACVELLGRKGDGPDGKPVLVPTGYRWTAKAAQELFGIDLPDGVQAREAILQIFPYPRDMLMMTHFNEYLEASMGYLPQIEEILRGESQAP